MFPSSVHFLFSFARLFQLPPLSDAFSHRPNKTMVLLSHPHIKFPVDICRMLSASRRLLALRRPMCALRWRASVSLFARSAASNSVVGSESHFPLLPEEMDALLNTLEHAKSADVTRILLSHHGADSHGADASLGSPLRWAVRARRHAVAEMLIGAGADITCEHLLADAVGRVSDDFLRRLANSHTSPLTCLAALEAAAKYSCSDSLKVILSRIKELTAAEDSRNAANEAMRRVEEAMAGALCSALTPRDSEYLDYRDPCDVRIAEEWPSGDRSVDNCVKFLLDCGIAFPIPPAAPLLAVKARSAKALAHILARGASPNHYEVRKCGGVETPLCAVVATPDYAGGVCLKEVKIKMAHLLLSRGANPNPFTEPCHRGHMVPPLAVACRDYSSDMATLLVDNGADVNSTAGGTTALHEASTFHSENDEILKLLLKHNAKPNVFIDHCQRQKTPLLCAIRKSFGGTAAVKLLLKAGADPNLGTMRDCEEGDYTALCYALSRDSMTLTEELLSAGADPNKVSRNGRMPLIMAAGRPFVNGSIITSLLEAGADPNAVGDDWKTALHYVCERPNGQSTFIAVCSLLKAGADPNALSGSQERPIDVLTRSECYASSTYPVIAFYFERTVALLTQSPAERKMSLQKLREQNKHEVLGSEIAFVMSFEHEAFEVKTK